MKNKAVFLANRDRNSIQDVYSEAMMARLDEMVEMYPSVIDNGNMQQHEEALREAEFAFSTWGMIKLGTEEIRHYFPKLKAVFYAAGSVQYFAQPFLDNGIMVVSAWTANAVPVAEFTVAQIVLANKGILQTMPGTKRNRKEATHFARNFPGNYDVKVGILGAGAIGRLVIQMLAPYKMELYVFDPFLSDERAREMGVRKTDLESVFAECQTISNHLANLPETVGILNRNHFDRMQPYATFINTGRGAQVVEPDLIRALKKVPTRTAVLDVTYPEPPEPDSELLELDNVWLTPHLAGSAGREVVRMAETVIEECRRYLAGESVHNQVTHEMLKTMA